MATRSPSALADLDGATSNQKWQFTPPDTGLLSSVPAVAFDGTIYDEEAGCVNTSQVDVVNCLDSIDGTSGSLKNQVQLPTDVISSLCYNRVNPGRVTAPIVAPDGQVYLLADSKQQPGTGAQGDCTYNLNETLALLKNGTPYATLATYSQYEGGAFTYSYFFAPLSVIPDGRGGFLASFESWAGGGRALLTVADTNGASASFPNFNIVYQPWDNMVLGDSNTAFITDGTRVVSFSTTSLQTNWTYTSADGVGLVAATSDGGIAINDSQLGFIQLDQNGEASTPVATLEGARPLGPTSSVAFGGTTATWFGTNGGELAMLAGPSEPLGSLYAEPEANTGDQRSAMPVPTSLHLVSSKLVPITIFPGCTLGAYFGIAGAMHYQVLDQANHPLKSSEMTPQEEILNVIFDGISGGNISWGNMYRGIRTEYPGTSVNTDSNGEFLDAPYGVCSNLAVTKITETQVIGMSVKGKRYVVRTNNWTMTAPTVGHGTMSNGKDVNLRY